MIRLSLFLFTWDCVAEVSRVDVGAEASRPLPVHGWPRLVCVGRKVVPMTQAVRRSTISLSTCRGAQRYMHVVARHQWCGRFWWRRQAYLTARVHWSWGSCGDGGAACAAPFHRCVRALKLWAWRCGPHEAGTLRFQQGGSSTFIPTETTSKKQRTG